MELKAHFSNIHKVIIDHLTQAQSEIVAAIAWFTDRDIFEVLYKKARSGVKVSLVLIGDEINKGPGGLNFQRLSVVGGQVIFLPAGSRDEPIMHHKFCVIDRDIVITGSYNWSKKARSNDENITVVSDAVGFAEKYLNTFDSLIARVCDSGPVVADANAARRRLEMIRNLVLLGEQDDVSTHLHKLRPIAEALQLAQIIVALDNGEYKSALEHIDAYLCKRSALVVADDLNIAILRFHLETLELRLSSLSDEKADLERRMITFNRRHDDALGDLIQHLLKARAELARMRLADRREAKGCEEAEAAARDAEQAYKDYAWQHEELKRAEALPKLDDETERELKSLYRRACSLCHPDKVSEERKQDAHHFFVELQEAYKSNDLTRVRELYEVLKTGGILEARSTILNKVESLRAAIAELEYVIAKLVAELKALQGSDGVKLMKAAGDTEIDWEYYFEQQRELLEMELANILSDHLATHTDE
jgi:hypothetical protein